MKRPYPRVLIAAPSSRSGKTTVVCGLLAALLQQGVDCVSFKCGPDYIDPMFHKYVLGVSGSNLDSFFLDRGKLLGLFGEKARQADISVIEGVMGYYDGLGGSDTAASTYEIARITDSPVILVVDGKGASLSLAAVIKGFLEYRKDSHICGVILNRVSPVMAERLKPAIEELGIRLLGCLPEVPALQLESRHLGLLMPEDIHDLRTRLDRLAVELQQTVMLDEIRAIAQEASWLDCGGEVRDHLSGPSEPCLIRIGVARDAAFCFYYQENLELLEYLGAELVEFSPLTDKELPAGISGLILGGGYPENYGKELSANKNMQSAIYEALSGGMPVLAECGGFMYLMEEMEAADKGIYPMVGIIPGKAFNTGRLSRFGYIELKDRNPKDVEEPSANMRAHEFHYWDTTSNGDSFLAKKPVGDRSWECIHKNGGRIAGFPHLYYLSKPEFIKNWIKCCEEYGKDKI